MRKRVLAIIAAFACIAPAAAIASQPSTRLKAEYTLAYKQVRSLPAEYPAGCNLLRHMCASDRNPSAAVVEKSLIVLNEEIAVYQAALAAPPVPVAAPAADQQTPVQQSAPVSGGGGGCYSGVHGAFQFDCQTWHSIGGTGDPVNYSYQYQEQMAANLLRQRGNEPWPNCGAGHRTYDLNAIAQCESGGNPQARG